MIVAGCVLKPREELSDNAFLRSGKLLGDASYALYLCHPIVMSAFAMAWFATELNAWFRPYVGAGLSIVLAIVTAIVVYRGLEFPLTRLLQRRARAGTEKRSLADLKTVSQRA
jgi:peptidoglycan/LPS O-acetylase OafA/YrhL